MPRDYSYSEMLQMQEQAMKRVQDMQKKARQTAADAQEELTATAVKEPPKPSLDFTPPVKREPAHISMPVRFKDNEKPAQEENVQLVKTGEGGSFLTDIFEDPDKAIILALLLLLRSEGADEILMMSLLYILV